MNEDLVDTKGKQRLGDTEDWWAKLIYDDLIRAAGKLGALTGILQERYGYSRQQAAEEIDKKMAAYEASLKK